MFFIGTLPETILQGIFVAYGKKNTNMSHNQSLKGSEGLDYLVMANF